MDSIQLRIRIDGDIAEKALKMAQARGMDLPDVVRMMLIKAVQIGDFAIGNELAKLQQLEQHARRKPYFEYEASQWNSMKTQLDAELALALLHQFIASRTLELEALSEQDPPDAERIGQLGQQRDQARQSLAALDLKDLNSVHAILEQFSPVGEPLSSPNAGQSDQRCPW
ncbi:MAG: hypothetical protein JSS56_28000 [Proteobacteria bacterium]|nr:hypothetical protein [Pseudomonadota bacterium]